MERGLAGGQLSTEEAEELRRMHEGETGEEEPWVECVPTTCEWGYL
jgi:hypothetical protein